MARPKSQTLFHFTPKLEYLKSILRNGFHPRYCLEDMSWSGQSLANAFPMVCFCDIPLGRVDQHVQQYGNYGIGMSRTWAVRNRLNPVIYLSSTSMLGDSVQNLNSELLQMDEAVKKKPRRNFLEIARNIKPLTGSMKVKGVMIDNVDFYQESEWRYVPDHDQIDFFIPRSKWDTDGVIEAANKKTFEHCLLGFNADDIRYLFVEKDADIPELVDFMRSSASGLGKRFTDEDMKILQTRIVSQESLAQDL
ncbi:abortive infection system antitoxin AbiGi family protein [Burkholderia guangdongensis]|uniref:abortive infection system antitoxin AbiGi family protein n=1 Tax=Burkholderia guangdongensis TaxID=1792500 RepID=UPI0015CAF12E|nr:abortive infection system antitoxin AbiGi family protein [Burkholderia guangdongensis]